MNIDNEMRHYMKKMLIISLCWMIYILSACSADKYLQKSDNSESKNAQLEKSGEEIHIKGLIKKLSSNDCAEREKTQQDLIEINKQAKPFLMIAAQDSDIGVKSRAQNILKLIDVNDRLMLSDNVRHEFPNIYQVMASGTDSDKFALTDKLARNPNIEQKDIEKLVGEILNNGNGLSWDQKVIILRAGCDSIHEGSCVCCRPDSHCHERVWKKPIPGAVPHIIKLLKDNDHYVREQTLGTLVRYNAKNAVSEIVKLLDDKVLDVRLYTINALAKLNAKETVSEISKLLGDENKQIRGWAAISLIELDKKELVPQKLVDDIKDILCTPSLNDRNRARNALKILCGDNDKSNNK